MLKNIHLRLQQIKYSGASVGRDVRIEIDILGINFRLDKRIKAGQTIKIDREVGTFTTDRNHFQTDVLITVIEKDVLFNDVGSNNASIKIDTTLSKPQIFVGNIAIKERRSKRSSAYHSAEAIFEITLEASAEDVIKYVADSGDGWLRVVMDTTDKIESIPAYAMVRIERVDNKREFFTILEGHHRGKRASVALQSDGSSQFVFDVTHEPPIHATYSISQKRLILNGKKFQTVDYPSAPWQKGLYDIEIPDYPHGGGRLYPEAKRAKVWFRIGHDGDRYLHAGGRSLGCITVIETKRWPQIYNKFIKARKGDFMSVGVLEVVD